jgi:hypothetical protein
MLFDFRSPDVINQQNGIYLYSNFLIFKDPPHGWIMQDESGGLGDHKSPQEAIMSGFKYHPDSIFQGFQLD